MDDFDPAKVVVEIFTMHDYFSDDWKKKKINCFSRIIYDGKEADHEAVDIGCQSYGKIKKIYKNRKSIVKI
ncbi:MAG: hypothetical protein HQK81_09100 [Desulfovibrionaceae bacterium]|nr:hypothetical protein [Desulfovibrionaceae bacterium]MBF0514201.1 hypothetical protein [Desulfovibrionaceae bacterium]